MKKLIRKLLRALRRNANDAKAPTIIINTEATTPPLPFLSTPIWIIQPFGHEQCVDDGTNTTATIQPPLSSISTLTFEPYLEETKSSSVDKNSSIILKTKTTQLTCLSSSIPTWITDPYGQQLCADDNMTTKKTEATKPLSLSSTPTLLFAPLRKKKISVDKNSSMKVAKPPPFPSIPKWISDPYGQCADVKHLPMTTKTEAANLSSLLSSTPTLRSELVGGRQRVDDQHSLTIINMEAVKLPSFSSIPTRTVEPLAQKKWDGGHLIFNSMKAVKPLPPLLATPAWVFETLVQKQWMDIFLLTVGFARLLWLVYARKVKKGKAKMAVAQRKDLSKKDFDRLEVNSKSVIERLQHETMTLETALEEAHLELARQMDKTKGSDDMICRLEEELASANQKIKTTIISNKGLELDLNNAMSSCAALTAEATKHQDLINQATAVVTALRGRVAELEQTCDTITKERDEQNAKLGEVHTMLHHTERKLDDSLTKVSEIQVCNENFLAEASLLQHELTAEVEILQHNFQAQVDQAKRELDEAHSKIGLLEVALEKTKQEQDDAVAAFSDQLEAANNKAKEELYCVSTELEEKLDQATKHLCACQTKANKLQIKLLTMTEERNNCQSSLDTKHQELFYQENREKELQGSLTAMSNELTKARIQVEKLQTERDDVVAASQQIRAELQAQVDQARKELREALAKVSAVAATIETTKCDHDVEVMALKEKIAASSRELTNARTEVEKLQAEREEALAVCQKVRTEMQTIELREASAAASDLMAQTKREKEVAMLKEQLTTKLRKKLDLATADLCASQAKSKELQSKLTTMTEKHDECQTSLGTLQQELIRFQGSESELQRSVETLAAQLEQSVLALKSLQSERNESLAKAEEAKSRLQAQTNKAKEELAAYQSKVSEVEATLEQAKQTREAEVSTLKEQLEDAVKTKEESSSVLQRVQIDLDQAKGDLSKSRDELENLQSKLMVLTVERDELRTNLQSMQQEMLRRQVLEADKEARLASTTLRLELSQNELEKCQAERDEALASFQETMAQVQAEADETKEELGKARSKVAEQEASLSKTKPKQDGEFVEFNGVQDFTNKDDEVFNVSMARQKQSDQTRDGPPDSGANSDEIQNKLVAMTEERDKRQTSLETMFCLQTIEADQHANPQLIQTELEKSHTERDDELVMAHASLKKLQSQADQAKKEMHAALSKSSELEAALETIKCERQEAATELVEHLEATNQAKYELLTLLSKLQKELDQAAAEQSASQAKSQELQKMIHTLTREKQERQTNLDKMQEELEDLKFREIESQAGLETFLNAVKMEFEKLQAERDEALTASQELKTKFEANVKKRETLKAQSINLQEQRILAVRELTKLKRQMVEIQCALTEAQQVHIEFKVNHEKTQQKLKESQLELHLACDNKTELETRYLQLVADGQTTQQRLRAQLDATQSELSATVAKSSELEANMVTLTLEHEEALAQCQVLAGQLDQSSKDIEGMKAREEELVAARETIFVLTERVIGLATKTIGLQEEIELSKAAVNSKDKELEVMREQAEQAMNCRKEVDAALVIARSELQDAETKMERLKASVVLLENASNNANQEKAVALERYSDMQLIMVAKLEGLHRNVSSAWMDEGFTYWNEQIYLQNMEVFVHCEGSETELIPIGMESPIMEEEKNMIG